MRLSFAVIFVLVILASGCAEQNQDGTSNQSNRIETQPNNNVEGPKDVSRAYFNSMIKGNYESSINYLSSDVKNELGLNKDRVGLENLSRLFDNKKDAHMGNMSVESIKLNTSMDSTRVYDVKLETEIVRASGRIADSTQDTQIKTIKEEDNWEVDEFVNPYDVSTYEDEIATGKSLVCGEPVGFVGEDIELVEMRFDNKVGLEVKLRSTSINKVEVNSITLNNFEKEINEDLATGNEKTLQLNSEKISKIDKCNSYDVIINYDSGNLEKIEIEGKAEAGIKINN